MHDEAAPTPIHIPWQFLGLISFLALSMALAQVLYMRKQIDEELERAAASMSSSPRMAYQDFHHVLEGSDLLTLGRISEARNQFIDRLDEAVKRPLRLRPAPDSAYSVAREAIDILQELEHEYGVDTEITRNLIVIAVKESAQSQLEEGTLSGWQGLQSFFRALEAKGLVPRHLIENYDEWIANIRNVERRPLGLRDAIHRVAQCLQLAFNQLPPLSPASAGQPPVAPLPFPLSDDGLILADRHLREGLIALRQFDYDFPDPPTPEPILLQLRGQILFNRASMKLAHVRERGRTPLQLGTDFITDSILRPPGAQLAEVPPPHRMYELFLSHTRAEFEEAIRAFDAAVGLDESLRQAYLALSYAELAMLDELEQIDPGTNRALSEERITQVTGGVGRRVIDQLRQRNQPLMIVRMPWD